MSLRYKTLFIYAGKIIVSLTICFLISHFFLKRIDYAWSLISVVLVLSPEGTDVMELAITRFKGNLVGSAVRILLLFFVIPNPFNIIIGAVISLFLCDLLKLNAGARSTLAAMIIILLHKEGTHLWDSALTRIFAVATGSIVAMIVTFVFHSIFKFKVEQVANPVAIEEKKEGEA